MLKSGIISTLIISISYNLLNLITRVHKLKLKMDIYTNKYDHT